MPVFIYINREILIHIVTTNNNMVPLDHGLRCNPHKSQTILVTGVLNRLEHRTRREAGNIFVMMKGEQVPNVEAVKYLGVTINSKFSFVQHVSGIIRKMTAITGHVYLNGRPIYFFRLV